MLRAFCSQLLLCSEIVQFILCRVFPSEEADDVHSETSAFQYGLCMSTLWQLPVSGWGLTGRLTVLSNL